MEESYDRLMTRQIEKSPFLDAVAVWHMADENDSAGKNSVLSIHGDVKLGVKLEGLERKASLKRGGDGEVALFNGGYLSAEQGADGELNLSGKEMTMCIRLRVLSENWNSPLFGKYGGEEEVSYYLNCVDGSSKPFFDIVGGGGKIPTAFNDLFAEENAPKSIQGTKSLMEFVWGTEPIQEIVDGLVKRCGDTLVDEAKKGIMRVNFPVALIESTDWHDVIVRFTGAKLELFIDGVLLDEEFPLGELRQNSAPCLIGAAFENDEIKSGFHGMIDHAALWNRALSDDEIAKLSGGKSETKRRELEILGKEKDRMQYYRPRGHNTRAGDCIPFFHDDTYHLFYLIVRRNRHSKWQCGHGGLQIYHASTKDLIHWEHHPIAIPLTEQWESWLGTGAFAYHNGLYYAFYLTPNMLKELNYGGIQLATSVDGIHFKKEEPHPFMRGGDCEIYQDNETGLFHMLKIGEHTDDGKISLKRLVSNDLRKWEEAEEPFIVADASFSPQICPHLFEWNGLYYFIAGRGVWMSENQFGPWELHTPSRLDLLSVPKTAAFTENRRIFAGFLGDRGWGGNLVFRELIQNGDGTLGTKFPPEMIPLTGAPLKLAFESISDGASGNDKKVQIKATDGFETGMFTDMPKDFRITLKIDPKVNSLGDNDSYFGVCIKASGDYEKGCELRFEPDKHRAQFGVPYEGGIGKESGQAIEHVEGLDRTFNLDIVVKDDIVDVSIDNRRTIVTRYWNADGDRLFFFAQNADVVFYSIKVRPLSE